MKTVYQTDDAGLLVGEAVAYPNPRKKGAYLLPAGAVTIAPPSAAEGQRARWVDGAWALEPVPADPEPEIIPPTTDDLIAALRAEKNRRLAVGFAYDFGDARGVHQFGTTRLDMEGWDQVTKLADAFRTRGMGSETIGIDTDTGRTTVTADEWPDVLIASGAAFQPVWQASFDIEEAIKAGEITDVDGVLNAVEWPN